MTPTHQPPPLEARAMPPALHPCRDLPAVARTTFERLARGEQPSLHNGMVAVLLRRGLIEEVPDVTRVIGTGTGGRPVTMPTWRLTTTARAEWHAWFHGTVEIGAGDATA